MKCKNNYRLPLNKKDIKEITKKSPAHKGKLKHSVDFVCKEGTPIYTAFGGKVVNVKQNSNIGGFHRRYWFKGNRIVIEHNNGEYSAYEHLKYKGSKVKVGQIVKKGQLIGYSGNTGYSSCPHLHFEVFRFTGPNKNKDYETLQVSFKNIKCKLI